MSNIPVLIWKLLVHFGNVHVHQVALAEGLKAIFAGVLELAREVDVLDVLLGAAAVAEAFAADGAAHLVPLQPHRVLRKIAYHV